MFLLFLFRKNKERGPQNNSKIIIYIQMDLGKIDPQRCEYKGDNNERVIKINDHK